MSNRIGVKGFQKATEISSKLQIPSSSMNKDISELKSPRNHGRTCICSDNFRCYSIQQRYLAMNHENAIGFSRFVVSKDSSTDLYVDHRYLDSKTNIYCHALGVDVSVLSNAREFISYSHFPPNYLAAAWSRKTPTKYIEFTLPYSEGIQYGFNRMPQISKASTDKLVFVEPNFSFEDNEALLDELERSFADIPIRNTTRQEKANIKNHEANVKEIANWISDDLGLMSTFERMKRDSGEVLQTIRLDNENLLQELNEKIDEIKALKELNMQGMTRVNLTSDIWHKYNPTAAAILFRIGTGSWEEAKKIFSALWPHIGITFGSGDDPITEFEKALITRMRMAKAMKLDMIGLIFNRSKQRIGCYINSWAPKWGAAGMDLSILDVSDYLIANSMPQAYIDKKIDGYPILVDGTDIMKSACRKNAAIKRMEFSDKVKHEAVRGITYTLAMGLIIEHTPLNLARCTEGGLISDWGSRYKEVPLEPLLGSFREEEIDDLADRKEFVPMFREISKFGKSIAKSQRDSMRRKSQSKCFRISETSTDGTSSGNSSLRNSFVNADSDANAYDYSSDDELQPGINEAMDDLLVENEALGTSDDLIDEISALTPSAEIENGGVTYNVVDSAQKEYAILKSIRLERAKLAVNKTGADLTVESITAYNEQTNLYYGPDKDNCHKARQLLRHERLHQLYKKGELKKCALSYYLDRFGKKRRQMLDILFGKINNRRPLRMLTRLAKFNYKAGILADRGFANDAPKYPNFNPHLTPSFLCKRRQFMSSEISKDRDVCTLRYTSEAIFSHVFDEECLKDVVPYTFNHILEDAWNWGHAAANFMQPLRNPKDWDEYQK